MELQVQKRTILGRGVSQLRKQGLVPAELYGRGLENLHLSVPAKEFRKVFKQAGENTLVNVVLDGKKHPTLINEVAVDYLSGEIESVDFYQVRMDEKLQVGVPLEFIGVAPAVKEKNGLLVKAMQEIEVEVLPSDIPHHFEVNLSKITEIGQSIYVKDLVVSDKVKVLPDPQTVVATVTAKVTEEEELAMQQAAGASLETVKVETEEKKAEREAAKATAPEAGVAAPAKETPKAEKKETPKK